MAPRLHDAGPGRVVDAARIVELHDEIAGGRRPGATIFVGGDDSHGRETLLRAAAAELGRSRSAVVAGRIERGSFDPWERDNARRQAALDLVESVMPMAKALHPAVAMISLLASQGKAAMRLLAALADRNRHADPAMLLPQMLRSSAVERPVACLIDCAPDAQTGWWEDLLVLFAQEIASDLPVLLVIGLEGASDLEDDADAMAGGRFAARTLTRRHIAEWWPLEAIGRDDLADWIGPAEPSVLDALIRSSGGRSALAAQLWHAWEAHAIVERRSRRWTFTRSGRANVLVDHLTRLVGVDQGLAGVERARELLAVAALEGRQFTAQAVGGALDVESDEMLDYLDETLVVGEGRPDGMVDEVGAITIDDGDGERHMWLYRFVSELEHLTLRHSLSADEETRYSARLAHALVACYGEATSLVAATVARLFDVGGKAEVASVFWRMTRIGQDDEVTMWRARRVLEGAEPVGALERRWATEILLDAVRLLHWSQAMTDGLALAQTAVRYAEEGSEDLGTAHYYSAWFRTHLEQLELARADLETALVIARRLHLTSRIADAMHQIANLDYKEGKYAAARLGYRAVLEMRVTLEDLTGVVTVREMLAQLMGVEGDIDGARSELDNVLVIAVHLEDLPRQAGTLIRLASLDNDQGLHERARKRYAEALTLSQRAGNRYHEASTRYGLAQLNLELDDYEGARAEMVEALALEEGNPQGQAMSHRQLGQIEAASGDMERAHAHYREAMTLYLGLGDTERVAVTRQELDELSGA